MPRRALILSLLLLGLLVPSPSGAYPASAMGFAARPVRAAQTLGQGAYEPSLSASASGALYLAAHDEGADGTRALAWVSRDEGATWTPLPGPIPAPATGQPFADETIAALPGPGDEGIVVAGPAGQSFMFDAGAATGTLYAWCGEGATLCRDDPFAYDAAGNANEPCGPGILDRPWIATGHGELVLVNDGYRPLEANPQVAIYDPVTGAHAWRFCLGAGAIPGPPAIRDADGTIALAQTSSFKLRVLHGASLADLAWTPALADVSRVGQTMTCGGSGNYGFTAVSAAGTFYVAIAVSPTAFEVLSTRDFTSYQTATYDAGRWLTFLWIAGSPTGEGALVSWADSAACDGVSDIHALHATSANGTLALADPSLVVAGAQKPLGDYMGSTLLPDGRAALAVDSASSDVPRDPLTVYVQTSGPTV